MEGRARQSGSQNGSSSRRRPAGTRHSQVQLALSSCPTSSAARAGRSPGCAHAAFATTLPVSRGRYECPTKPSSSSTNITGTGSAPRSGCTVQHTPWTYASARTHRRRGSTGHRLCLARTPRFPRARIARRAANAFQTSRGERQHVTPTASSDVTELADGVRLLRFMSEERIGLLAPSVVALLQEAWCDWAF